MKLNFNEIIGKITYKPGFEFKVGMFAYHKDCEQWALNIDHRTTCINSGEPTVICHSSGFLSDQFLSEESFIAFVHDAVKRAEIHELNEHFRIDGEFFIDPHELERKYDKVRNQNNEKYIKFKSSSS